MSCITDLIKANELGKKNMQVNNEPAFPSGLMSDDNKPYEVSALHNGITIRDGLTIRDYFAAKAMQAYIAKADIEADMEDIAFDSYLAADSMLQERKK